jgi:carbonic anhydrase
MPTELSTDVRLVSYGKARCNLRKGWITPVLLLAAEVLVPAGSSAQWKTPWSYAGPNGAEHWGDLDPEYAACNAGKEQSPIDIRTAEKADLPALRFEYRSSPLKYLINNGYTIRVNYHDTPGSGSFLSVGGKRYHLTQFHFHRPSEEYIQGKPYDMVVHLMHEASDGKVAGVAILLKAGGANATIQRIWDHMPETRGQEREIAGVDVDPAGLLPGGAAYYTYMGSLTAPPCTEGVTWFVLKTPVDISPAQIDAFARLYPHDVRPLQPLNGRIVQVSR